MNPAYFGSHSLIEILQTLGHEQCHLWQFEFGNPGCACYHNREWADKMLAIGLVPSDTGKPGGKQTGQKMSDYPAPGGRFLKVCIELMRDGAGLPCPWVDRMVAVTESCHPRHLAREQLQQKSAEDVDRQILEMLETPVSSLVPELERPENVKIAAAYRYESIMLRIRQGL